MASFHGLFDPPPATQPIAAKVIAFHGWDDPMVPPAAVVALGEELTAAGCRLAIYALAGSATASPIRGRPPAAPECNTVGAAAAPVGRAHPVPRRGFGDPPTSACSAR